MKNIVLILSVLFTLCFWGNAQHLIKPTIYFVNLENGKIAKLKFGKEYSFFINPDAAARMGLTQNFNGCFLKPILQIGDSMVFKEGKLAKGDVDSIITIPSIAKFVLPTIALMGTSMVILNHKLDPTRKIWFTMLIVPVVGTIQVLTYLARPKTLYISKFQLIPQNTLGKEPLRKTGFWKN